MPYLMSLILIFILSQSSVAQSGYPKDYLCFEGQVKTEGRDIPNLAVVKTIRMRVVKDNRFNSFMQVETSRSKEVYELLCGKETFQKGSMCSIFGDGGILVIGNFVEKALEVKFKGAPFVVYEEEVDPQFQAQGKTPHTVLLKRVDKKRCNFFN